MRLRPLSIYETETTKHLRFGDLPTIHFWDRDLPTINVWDRDLNIWRDLQYIFETETSENLCDRDFHIFYETDTYLQKCFETEPLKSYETETVSHTVLSLSLSGAITNYKALHLTSWAPLLFNIKGSGAYYWVKRWKRYDRLFSNYLSTMPI